MTEFTSEHLAELKAVAEAATEGAWNYENTGSTDPRDENHPFAVFSETATRAGHCQEVIGYDDMRGGKNDATHIAAFDPPTVLSLIAALEAKTAENVQIQAENESLRAQISAKTYEAERLRAMGRGLIKERDAAQLVMNTHSCGENVEAAYRRTIEAERERDEAREMYRDACEAEDALNGINDALIARVEKAERERDEARAAKRSVNSYLRLEREAARQNLHRAEKAEEERDDARAALKAKDSYVGDLEEQIQHIKSLWRATGRAETDAQRRAVRAEAAIEWVRIAATEVTNQGDNHGRTHYENCWTQHLHCLAAKIIYETGADDE